TIAGTGSTIAAGCTTDSESGGSGTAATGGFASIGITTDWGVVSTERGGGIAPTCFETSAIGCTSATVSSYAIAVTRGAGVASATRLPIAKIGASPMIASSSQAAAPATMAPMANNAAVAA